MKKEIEEPYQGDIAADIIDCLQKESSQLRQSHQKLKEASIRLLEWHDDHYDISFIDDDIIEALKQALTDEG